MSILIFALTGEAGARTVANLIIGYGRKSLVEVTVDTDGDSGSATGKVTATDGHPLWLPDQRVWVKAEQLQAGSMVQTAAGTWVQVTAVRTSMAVQLVYNLTVADIHTYYVLAASASVLVHNCGESSLELQADAGEIRRSDFAAEYTSQTGHVYRSDNKGLSAFRTKWPYSLSSRTIR